MTNMDNINLGRNSDVVGPQQQALSASTSASAQSNTSCSTVPTATRTTRSKSVTLVSFHAHCPPFGTPSPQASTSFEPV